MNFGSMVRLFQWRRVPRSSCRAACRIRFASSAPGQGAILRLLTPGGLEEFFVEAAARELRLPDQMTEVAELAARYGIEFRGPAKWAD